MLKALTGECIRNNYFETPCMYDHKQSFYIILVLYQAVCLVKGRCKKENKCKTNGQNNQFNRCQVNK